MGFFSTLWGLLVRPLQTLPALEKREPELRMELATGFLLTVTFLGALPAAAVVLGVQLLLGPGVDVTGGLESVFRSFSALLSIGFFSVVMFFGVVGTFLGGLYYHFWLKLFGVRDWKKTFRAYVYAKAPSLLMFLFFAPQGAGFMMWLVLTLWTLLLFTHGVRLFHDLPMRSAGVVIGLGFLVNVGVFLVAGPGSPLRFASALLPQSSPASVDLLSPVFTGLFAPLSELPVPTTPPG